jgi:hypothetical protein
MVLENDIRNASAAEHIVVVMVNVLRALSRDSNSRMDH